MNAREKILSTVKKNKPASAVSLPEIHTHKMIRYENMAAQFANVLSSIGGKCIETGTMEETKMRIAEEMKEEGFMLNLLDTVDPSLINKTSHELESLERVYIRGAIGVAENGAAWIPEDNFINRIIPFISQHLVLILEKKHLVATMHDAMLQLPNPIDHKIREGYGVFIAGPSKTADIEQSLVIGAHGARSLVVYLVG